MRYAGRATVLLLLLPSCLLLLLTSCGSDGGTKPPPVTPGWSTFGSGFLQPVRALAPFRGNLIAGGSFSQAGDSTVGGIARWDGTTWRPMAAGFGGGESGNLCCALAVRRRSPHRGWRLPDGRRLSRLQHRAMGRGRVGSARIGDGRTGPRSRGIREWSRRGWILRHGRRCRGAGDRVLGRIRVEPALCRHARGHASQGDPCRDVLSRRSDRRRGFSDGEHRRFESRRPMGWRELALAR